MQWSFINLCHKWKLQMRLSSEMDDKSFAFGCVGRCSSSSTCRATNVLFAQRKCTYYTFEDLENLSGFDDVLYRKTYPPSPVCQNGGTWSDTTKTSCDCPVSFTGTYCERYWDDCSEGFKMGISSDGVYTIQPRPYGTPFQVHCKMKYGGRTSVQKQVSGDIDFYRTWQEYRDGFGTPGGDHWLGLEKMKAISDKTPSKMILRLTYKTDKSPTWKNIIYNYFNLSDELNGFRFDFISTKVPSQKNAFSEAMTDLKGARFSTKDRDNDEDPAGSCSQTHHSGWWFRNCTLCNPNGQLKPIPNTASDPDDVFCGGDTRGVKETSISIGAH
ncbi:fibrinogen C domain-containing protein 1-A-like [Haliotis rufescens]|uniref:fibrinogen C domain-containing protein 1-A-like n=1 Tax=Haliotis rufescens TaxID=6454 RepID=UPI00201F6A47|nr:fibrinogen C domain-containing protein 1-A-like [Haliotis rufescens]